MKREIPSTNRENGFIGKYKAFVLKEEVLVYRHFRAEWRRLLLPQTKNYEKRFVAIVAVSRGAPFL